MSFFDVIAFTMEYACGAMIISYSSNIEINMNLVGLFPNEKIIENNHRTIYQRFCEISDFGEEGWAVAHGC